LDEENGVVRQIAGMAFPGNGRWLAQVLRDLAALPARPPCALSWTI